MRALDLFAGTGWGVACKRLNIDEHGVENMKEAVATRSLHDMATIHDDVWTFQPHFDYEGEIASPPCQTFSVSGSGSGRKALDAVLGLVANRTYKDIELLREAAGDLGDDRTGLVLTPLHFWHLIRPQWVAFEQVSPVLPVWEACAEVMRDAGYHAWTGNLTAEMYGVPQTRKRAFLLAHRDHEVAPPEPTHSRYYPRDKKRLDEGVKPWVSMAEALTWGLSDRPSPTITGGGTETGGAEPIAKISSRYHHLPSWVHQSPSPTIVGTFRPDVVAAHGWRKAGDGPRQNAPGSVRVTVAEAATLQSYPDGFEFCGAQGKQYLQVGNAVPPLLAETLLRSLQCH